MSRMETTYHTKNTKGNLPAGWRWVKLGKLCEIIAGQSPPGSTYRTIPEGLPFFQGKADFGLLNPVPRVWCVEPNKIALPGDILISVRAPVGPTNVADVKCCIGRGLAAIRCGGDSDRDFILSALRRFESRLTEKGAGSTFEAISRDDLEQLSIPLPPLSEQRRIAGLLRERMAAVEKARAAAQARLEAVKTLPASLLRQVFPQPGQPLPVGWRWVRLGEVIGEAQAGFACGLRDPQGIAQLRMNNLDTRGNFVWDDVLRVPHEANDIEQFLIVPGDVLFNNTNSTELVGKSALFEGYVEPIVFSNHFTRLRTVTENLLPDFLASWLNHQWQQGVFTAICNRWIGQSAVKADKLLNLDFPLPPLDEQRRIAAVLREQMAMVEKARVAVEEELQTINALPAALLRRAFNGEI